MGVFRSRTWLVYLGLLGCFHLMPGVHEFSHAHHHEAQTEFGSAISTVEDECAACSLLSSSRDAATVGPTWALAPRPPAIQPLLPAGTSIAYRTLFADTSPRAPPTA